MGENMLCVTDDNFEEVVIKSDIPVLVDFWAEWCGPCRTIAPIVEELAGEYSGKIKACKLNIDENPTTPTKFAIRSIPTLLLFKGGEIQEQIIGAKSKADIKKMIDTNLT